MEVLSDIRLILLLNVNTQTPGLDYHETFAPVAKLTKVHCLLAVASIRNWLVHKLDMHNAFFIGDFAGEVYMRLPLGYSQQRENLVCRLHKSLYGFKRASRNWFSKLS